MASPKMVLYGFEQENIQPLHGWTTTKMASHQLGRDQACEFRLWSSGRWVQEVRACPGVAPPEESRHFLLPSPPDKMASWVCAKPGPCPSADLCRVKVYQKV